MIALRSVDVELDVIRTGGVTRLCTAGAGLPCCCSSVNEPKVRLRRAHPELNAMSGEIGCTLQRLGDAGFAVDVEELHRTVVTDPCVVK